jgi:uncharacterized protein YgbK (DUF1537 family)
MKRTLPSRVMSWYGDDFTGSTDVLEALAPHMPAVLFLQEPDPEFFRQFEDYAAFGLAGSSRSESPEWMDGHLPSAFAWLKSLGAAICHYKVCSTFDSSPTVGSIGRAIEIGTRIFGGSFVPMVVGVPSLRRYTMFGNLFAGAADGFVYRIDRHPAMMRHPVTPMREADLRLHLREQTALRIGLLDALQLESETACEQYRYVAAQADAVLIDVPNHRALQRAGHLLWDVERQPFIVGSSGVEYALIARWDDGKKPTPEPPPVDRLLVLCGSCSPNTQKQIEYAEAHGFALVPIDPSAASADDGTAAAAMEALERGGPGVVLYSARSPRDRVESFGPAERRQLSERSGQILVRLLDASGVRRVVIAGGDTSSHAGRQLSIEALTFVAHMAPGAPLCQAWSRSANRQGLEIIFKGGQCGREDFFETVRSGRGEMK